MNLPISFAKVSPTAMLKQEDWDGVCGYYHQHPDKIINISANAQNILFCAISYMRKGDVLAGLSLLSDDVLKTQNARGILRRWVISPLASCNLDVSLQVVNKLLDSHVCLAEDVLLVASCLIKRKHFNTASELTERAWLVFPENSKVFALYLRSLTLSDKEAQVLELARNKSLVGTGQKDIIYTCLYYLNKSRLKDDKALAFSLIQNLKADTEESTSLLIDILTSVGKFKDAIHAGESALAGGIDGAILRRSLGLACLNANRSRESKLRASEHFRQAVAFNPNNLRAATFYADVLIRTGQNVEAIPLIERWLSANPNMPYVRALYARALRQEGQHDAASAEFLRLASEKGITSKWNRYAAAALLQAGKRAEAESVFDRYVKAKREYLPATFEDGFRSLDDKIEQVNLPLERFDWAWEIGGKLLGLERKEWERRAKWGYLADNYLLDWLECQGNQADEPMYRLANIGYVEQFFNDLQLEQRGCIVVSAHLGAMYAGPMIMSLLKMNSRWVASTPSVSKGGYAEKLISVSDKSESEVVRACVQTLHSGQSIVVAIDGSLNLAAPTIEFLGQQITYSTFCSRLAYKMHIPTVFCVPVWRERHIHFVLEKMVDPLKFESQISFAERWKENYLKCVTKILQSAPENLRLSGGLWRNIARQDHS